jgi:hypothetical protein
MLSSLDTVIAFAVIMTVLCLFITILVQMISAALALRGKNLANALSLTFQTIDPHIAEHAHALTEQILKDPIFSDSLFAPKGREQSGNPLWRVLLEAEREVKAAKINWKELAKAAVDPAKKEEIGPALQEAENRVKEALTAASTAAAQVLPKVSSLRQKPWAFLSRGGTRLGNAIRPGEIYRVLHEISQLTESDAALRGIPHDLVEKSAAILDALKQPDQPATESKQKLQAIIDVAKHFPSDGEKKAIVDSVANLGATVERATTQAYDRFQRWFGSAQDRAEQWFQVHIRGLTIAFSILTAFLLQLDTTDIFRQLRDRPSLVEALVKSAPGVLEQGAKVLDSSDTPAYQAYLLWLRNHPLFPLKVLPAPGTQDLFHQYLTNRLKAPPDKSYPVERFAAAFDLARKTEGTAKMTDAEAAKAAYDDWIKKFPAYELPPTVFTGEASQESINAAISEKIASDPEAKGQPSPGDAAKWLAEYDALQRDGVMAFEKSRQESFRNLQATMHDTGFDLVPKPLLGRWDKETLPYWANCYWPPLAHYLRHLIGVLMTAGLLALGAPFWFNLLKNLMNLRPAVANLIEKRPQSTPALPSTPATPPSSS